MRQCGRVYFEIRFKIKEFAHGIKGHSRGVCLAVGGISCYVGCGNDCFVKQKRINLRFVLPCVYDSGSRGFVFKMFQPHIVVNHRATACVNYHGLLGEASEELFVAHVVCGVVAVLCKRNVKGYHVAFLLQCAESNESRFSRIASRRVVEQCGASETAAGFLYFPSHVSHTHYSHRAAAHVNQSLPCQYNHGALEVLPNRCRVAAGAVGPCYSGFVEIVCVYVVKTYGCRNNESHFGVVKKRGVAARAGSYNQRVGIFHVAAGYFRAGKVQSFKPEGFGYSVNIGYFVVYYQFHDFAGHVCRLFPDFTKVMLFCLSNCTNMS